MDLMDSAAPVRPRPFRVTRARLVLFLLALVVVLGARPVTRHGRAATLLVGFSDPAATPKVDERPVMIPMPSEAPVPARIYTPLGSKDAPGVVLVHGVQFRGIEDPRLVRFARSVAGAGVVVMTPEVAELKDYQVAPHSIETVGASVRFLRDRLGSRKVGLMGMSFGGGVSLLAAADPRFVDDVSFVVAVGAHDDLARVSRFFATDAIEEVTGTTKTLHAHEYGATVLVYSHAEDFFPAEDVPAARDALRFWLWERRDEAREASKRLSPASKAKAEKLFAADVASVREELLREIDSRTKDMATMSPHGRLGNLRANVYLLHGDGDTVIPSTEAAWLARDVPEGRLKSVLVSPALVHVELKEPSARDKWELVHFMGQVIGEAEDGR